MERISFEEMGRRGQEAIKNMSKVTIQKALDQVFNNASNSRRIKIWTGPGGYDLFSEKMEEGVGLKRIYMSKKPARFMKSKARRSAAGRYYILVKIVP